MKYKTEVVSFKGGFLDDAEAKAGRAIQTHLDEYAKKGWELHTCSINSTKHGAIVLLVWQARE